jgi:hypothetical protein
LWISTSFEGPFMWVSRASATPPSSIEQSPMHQPPRWGAQSGTWRFQDRVRIEPPREQPTIQRYCLIFCDKLRTHLNSQYRSFSSRLNACEFISKSHFEANTALSHNHSSSMSQVVWTLFVLHHWQLVFDCYCWYAPKVNEYR